MSVITKKTYTTKKSASIKLVEAQQQENIKGACDTFNYDFPTNHFYYKLIIPIVKIITFIGWKVKVVGKENIPKNTNVIFMPNHTSHFDGFLVGIHFPTTPLGIIDEKLFKSKIFSTIAKKINGFPVRKGTKSTAIVKYAIHRVNNGDSLLWFPEGQRNKHPHTNTLEKGKLGSGMLAHGVNVPIVPVFITGAEFAIPVGRKLSMGRGIRTIKINIEFGKPIYLDDLRKQEPSKEISQLTLNRIMDAIDELRLPGPYIYQKTTK